ILHRLAECRRFVARAARRRQERRDPAAGSRPRPPAIGDATPLHPGPPRRPTSSPEGNGLRAGLFPGQEYLQGAAGSSRLAGSLKAAPDRKAPAGGRGFHRRLSRKVLTGRSRSWLAARRWRPEPAAPRFPGAHRCSPRRTASKRRPRTERCVAWYSPSVFSQPRQRRRRKRVAGQACAKIEPKTAELQQVPVWGAASACTILPRSVSEPVSGSRSLLGSKTVRNLMEGSEAAKSIEMVSSSASRKCG